jgi:hypothetical protein
MGRFQSCFEGAAVTLVLKSSYAIVHAYHFLAPDMRLGVIIHFADHLRTVRYKDRQVSVAAGLSVHVACLVAFVSVL